ncbi:hypothetical protein XENOCAPTIV_007123 [Xenoophorus captivus]|uniref:C-type lectin domain-containing protein n=1 Tax=Xenoophorus captivus TaxID=1517983 RepID=A0ABV0SB08_9TELE
MKNPQRRTLWLIRSIFCSETDLQTVAEFDLETVLDSWTSIFMMSGRQSCSTGEAAASQHENPNRTSKLPPEKVVLLVLLVLLANALVVIYRLSFDKVETNKSLQTLKEENEALRKHLSEEPHLKWEAGWELHGGNCYKFNTNKSSWNESRRSCIDQGGDLVKIDSREEQILLEFRLIDLMESTEDMFWIGLTDSEEGDRWLWVDGSPLDKSLSFWGDSELQYGSGELPDDEDSGENEEMDEASDVSWFDKSCDGRHRSICEKAATSGQRSSVCL